MWCQTLYKNSRAMLELPLKTLLVCSSSLVSSVLVPAVSQQDMEPTAVSGNTELGLRTKLTLQIKSDSKLDVENVKQSRRRKYENEDNSEDVSLS